MQHPHTEASTPPPPPPPPTSAAARAEALCAHSAVVGRLLAKSKEQGAQVLRLGRELVFIDDHKLYEAAADEHGKADKDIYAWVKRVHELERDQAHKYLEIGRHLTPDLVADLAAGVEALYLMARADARLRLMLRQLLLNNIRGTRFELAIASAAVWLEKGVEPEQVISRVPLVAQGKLEAPGDALRKVLKKGKRPPPVKRVGLSQVLRLLAPFKGVLLNEIESATAQKSDERHLLQIEAELKFAADLLDHIRQRRGLLRAQAAQSTPAEVVNKGAAAAGATSARGRGDAEPDDGDEADDLDGSDDLDALDDLDDLMDPPRRAAGAGQADRSAAESEGSTERRAPGRARADEDLLRALADLKAGGPGGDHDDDEPQSAREAAAKAMAAAYAELRVPPHKPPLWCPPLEAPPSPVGSQHQRLRRLRQSCGYGPDDERIDASFFTWQELNPPPRPAPHLQRPRPDGTPYVPQDTPDPRPALTLPADWGQGSARIPLLDVMAVAGGSQPPQQFAILGTRHKSGDCLAINLNDCLSMLLVGSPGGGKSYLMAAILESALQQIYSINKLPHPMAGLGICLQPAGADAPELCSLALPNLHPGQSKILTHIYRALPEGVRDVVILTETEHVEAMRKKNPHAQVHGLRFSTEELIGEGLRIGLGFGLDKEPVYAAALQSAARRVRARDHVITWDALVSELEQEILLPGQKLLLLTRLRKLAPFVDDRQPARPWLAAGRFVLVHLHEDTQSYDHSMNMVALTLHTLVIGRPREVNGRRAPKLILVVDEAHKLADHPEVRRLTEQANRQRRHLDLNLIFASQDPHRLPKGILENLDGIGVFQHSVAKWAKALGQVAPPLAAFTEKIAARLSPGMVALYFKRWWLQQDDAAHYENEVVLAHVRPRVSHHGGATRAAGE